MKKIVIFILILLIVIGGSIYFTQKHFNNKNNISEVNEIKDKNQDKIENIEIINNEVENSEEPEKETVLEESNVTEEKKNDKKESKNKPVVKKEITKKEETSKKEVLEDTQIQIEEVKPAIKHTCTNSDSSFTKWLQEFKNSNETSRIFYSKEKAISYGENVGLENGYGYFYNKNPISYEDDYCKIDIYAVRLYIPAKTCENDKMIYLKANEEVINSIVYLKKLGYECSNKVES